MIHEILSELKLLETRLDVLMTQNIPDYLKEEELKIINEKLDELNYTLIISDKLFKKPQAVQQ